ncbi:MAG: YdeI/OmpD-associated family protein [Acidimicrobiia bacterium]
MPIERDGNPDARSYSTTVTTGDRGRVMVPVPFDPNVVWGSKPEHRVHGTVNGMNVRASVETLGSGFGIVLGPAWRRDCGTAPGDIVDVVLAPEGPQRDDLAEDLRAALDAEPAAGACFDGLAQFYRRAFLRWIDATKRRPDERARRIAEVIDLLKRGEKERPATTTRPT